MAGFSIEIVLGNITKIPTDAIVNAANERMLGGGGVDGAIHSVAGLQLVEACKLVDENEGVRCPTGEARITPAFNLPAEYVIHTVGPIWKGGGNDEEKLLASAYRSTMQIAEDNMCSSISFPSISTGAFGFPFQLACEIAIEVIQEFKFSAIINSVKLVCYSSSDFEKYSKILSNRVRS